MPGKCFADCTKLLNVKYAGTVTAIGDLAFESCKALTAAPIPETVTEIGASAFTGCTALTAIDYSGTEAEWAQLTKGENALPEGVTVNFNAPIHHYGSWTGTDPNCTTEGKRTRTCTDDGCGHTEEMTLPARPLLGHRPCDDAADGDHDRRAHLYLQDLRLQCHAHRGDPQACPAGARERAL